MWGKIGLPRILGTSCGGNDWGGYDDGGACCGWW